MENDNFLFSIYRFVNSIILLTLSYFFNIELFIISLVFLTTSLALIFLKINEDSFLIIYDMLIITFLIYLTDSLNMIWYSLYVIFFYSKTIKNQNGDLFFLVFLSNVLYLILNLLIFNNVIENINEININLYKICNNIFFTILSQCFLFLVIRNKFLFMEKNLDMYLILKQKFERITKELNHNQEKLIRLEKMANVGELSGSISKQIDNSISVIKVNIDLMENDTEIIFKQVPFFIEKLSKDEKIIFNDTLENFKFSLTLLNEDKNKAKEIKEKLLQYTDISDNSIDYATEMILKLNLEKRILNILKKIGYEKTFNMLKICEIFFNLNKHTERIKNSIEKTNKIVLALKNYSDIEKNNTKTKVNILSEIENVIKNRQNHINGKMSIFIDIPKNLEYYCYRENLFQVWDNVIYNAIQSLTKSNKKELSIKAYETNDVSGITKNKILLRKDYIVISIKDNGDGINDIFKEKIFTPFFTTKTLGEGIGLGLFISKEIINNHKGEIFFNSNETETEFIIILKNEQVLRFK